MHADKRIMHIFHHFGIRCIRVVVQFYPLFKFYFPLFLGMVIYDNELKTKENKI